MVMPNALCVVMPHLFLIFLYVTTVTISVRAKSFYEAVLTSAYCKISDPQIVYNYTCIHKQMNGTMSVVTQDITFQPGVVLDKYYVRIQLNRKFGKTFRPFMINAEQDLCALSKNNSIQSLITKVIDLKDRTQYGNWYHQCPVSGRRYEIDVPMDSNKIPAVALNGDYRLDLIGFTFVNGVKKEFRLTHLFGECRLKSNRGY